MLVHLEKIARDSNALSPLVAFGSMQMLKSLGILVLNQVFLSENYLLILGILGYSI